MVDIKTIETQALPVSIIKSYKAELSELEAMDVGHLNYQNFIARLNSTILGISNSIGEYMTTDEELEKVIKKIENHPAIKEIANETNPYYRLYNLEKQRENIYLKIIVSLVYNSQFQETAIKKLLAILDKMRSADTEKIRYETMKEMFLDDKRALVEAFKIANAQVVDALKQVIAVKEQTPKPTPEPVLNMSQLLTPPVVTSEKPAEDEPEPAEEKKKKEYICPVCGKRFGSKFALSGHMRSHDKE